MDTVSRVAAVVFPAAVFLFAYVIRRRRFGHSLIAPALPLIIAVSLFLTVFRFIVLLRGDTIASDPDTFWFSLVLQLNNYSHALWAFLVLVLLRGMWTWSRLGLPYHLTDPKRPPWLNG